jgi:hypothetical protein
MLTRVGKKTKKPNRWTKLNRTKPKKSNSLVWFSSKDKQFSSVIKNFENSLVRFSSRTKPCPPSERQSFWFLSKSKQITKNVLVNSLLLIFKVYSLLYLCKNNTLLFSMNQLNYHGILNYAYCSWDETHSKREREREITLLTMNSHCVPFPDAGAPDIMTFNGSLIEQFITFVKNSTKSFMMSKRKRWKINKRHKLVIN